MVVGGVPLHPTASLLAAYRFQPLKKALYANKEAKSTLYSNRAFLRKTRRRQGRGTPKLLPAGGLAPAAGSS